MLTYWDVLQVKTRFALTSLLDALPLRICDGESAASPRDHRAHVWNVFVECGLDFHAFEFHLQINFHVFARARESLRRAMHVPHTPLLFLSAILMRICSNTNRGEIAGAIYKQSKKIIVFDE